MSNNTIRIRTTPNGNDKYLKVKLEQDFDFIEVLSMKISQEEAYTNFCSDYGVVTGRVIISNGFGVPNAKVSIFIPIDDVDKNNPEIKGLYPYEIISDTDDNGVRYNLLPKTPETNNDCFTPIGTFPDKRDVLDNPEMLDIYCKYYRFTTTTNDAGDFMIFGVPIGTYTLHVDVDISDIGIISQRPYDSISQNTPSYFFDSPTKFKADTNLNKLIQVKSVNVGVNVQPFWGDIDSCEIGITRVDVDLNYSIRPSAIFMGSIFGDQDKNSVNKNCTPRNDMGKLCEQISNEGTIEMIRETMDGSIERFDVEGGRVIDENGAWAYQIPMNLDYMVTDEFGNMVLSDDPNKGIPTRASVRFLIGMDQTGGEARLRTRAKYLVPNNPNTQNEIDYEFGENTKKSSFRNLYWNKIYSVSNYIPRLQKNTTVQSNKMLGIKNVDSCIGDKTPFPYNRIDTDTSVILIFFCLIIKIIGFLVYLLNILIIPLINLIIRTINLLISFWNLIVDAFCSASEWEILGVKIFGFLGFMCNLYIPPVPYIPCVFITCPADDNPSIYAPGCSKTGLDIGASFDALVDSGNAPTYYNNDNFGHSGFGNLCGLDDCISLQLSQKMNMVNFSFYNDWVNGSLYSFLLKYKKRRGKKENFCEYDCDDFSNINNSTSVDENNDGVSDNECNVSYLLDTCFVGDQILDNQQLDNRVSFIREGYIKKINDEFIYAASTHDNRFKLFATEIVTLGSVFNCDWQGTPKIQDYLIPTTYQIPPLTQEVGDDNTTILTTGQSDIGGNTQGLFFKINCLGLHVNNRQCLNIRHICEFGVELDEYRGVGDLADGIIGSKELDYGNEDRGKFFRDVFLGLNTLGNLNLSLPYSSEFNTNNLPIYDFATTTNNGSDYINFRNYSLGNQLVNGDNLGQTEHSFYFYFGLIPGKTALDVMNGKFFTKCVINEISNFVIQLSTTPSSVDVATGSVTVTFVGGDSPFSSTISGPNGYTNTINVGENNTEPTFTLNDLPIGNYTVTSFDSNGLPISQSFTISGPPQLFADAYVSNDSTTSSSNNGQITISSVLGGIGSTYTYRLYNSNGGLVSGPTFITSVPYVINGLAVDTSINATYNPTGHGYTMTVTDGDDTVVINDLVVQGPSTMILTPNVTQILCYGANTGSISLNLTGGIPPFLVNTTSTNGYISNSLNMSNLSVGTYTSQVIDSMGTESFSTSVLTYVNPIMTIEKPISSVLLKQCDPNNYNLKLLVTSPYSVGSTVYLDYSVDQEMNSTGQPIWYPITINGYVNATTPLTITLPSNTFSERITFRMTNAAKTCHSENVVIDITEVRLPLTTLTINTNGVVNTKQCTPNQVKFKFNVSHLVMGSTTRAPYTVTYRVKGINSLGQLNGVVQYTTINTNQQEIIANVPKPSGFAASSCVVTVTVTDNAQCISNTINITIALPTTLLQGVWSTQGAPYQLNGQTYVHKILNVSGGVGTTYLGSPYQVYSNNPNNIYNYPQSTQLTSTVTDTVGCSIIVNG